MVAVIQLITSDGGVFYVGENVAKLSKTISDIIDDIEIEGVEDPIPIPNVSKDVLDVVLNWCQFSSEGHTGNEVEEFETRFFGVDSKRLLEIVSAANFLNIPDLLDKACSAVADLLRGKSPDEIRAVLGIEGEYSKEEKEAVMKENRWAFPETRVYYDR
ncbi:SKP1-like protein [Paramecium bursaria Chlorella virus NE-JV-1]|nr:SKP1-like protein [Paramecium bursaria Chlorella virus NE-JV-1]